MANDDNGKEESATESSSQVNVSRRSVAASILGIGGLGLFKSNANAHGRSKPRRWQQDVDAQGHDLFNLGSLGLQDTSSEITNLAGQNLTIDDGTLHSESTSGWGDSGEKVPLFSAKIEGNNPWGETEYPEIHSANGTLVPFESFSYTNISQILVSLTARAKARSGGSVLIRLVDMTEKVTGSPQEGEPVPIPDSEVEVTENSIQLVQGPKAPFESDEVGLFRYQARVKGEGGGISQDSVRLHVWGEIA